MKGKFYKIIPFILLIMLLIPACSYDNSKSRTLSLEHLKNDNNEYQYEDIEWGMSAESVTKSLPYAIKINTENNAPENITFYDSEVPFDLNGQKGTASFEFHDDKLAIVDFNFHLNGDYEQWFKTLTEELTQLYGTESDKKESSSDRFNSVVYIWETDNTMLQIALMTGGSIKPSAMIGVFTK